MRIVDIFVFFFFKQKTAYEMRISDWSSDVCSSDLAGRAAILSDYAAQARAADPGFAGFSAARGEVLFRGSRSGGDARTPSCTSCHTSDPRQPGRNAKTGRPIAPAPASAEPPIGRAPV